MRKKILLFFLIIGGTSILFAQNKVSYLSFAIKTGGTGLNYKLNSLDEKGKYSNGLGYGFDLDYSYYFDSHWGISGGVGLSHYSSKGKLKGSLSDDSFYNLGAFTDDDFEGRPRDFELRTRITNLEEQQTTFFVDIPVMLVYQTRFGDDQQWGLYGGIGAKLQLPFSTKFKIKKGGESEFNVSGKYEGIPTDMGSPSNPPVPQHGYGTITDPNASLNWSGKGKLKLGVAGTVDFGVLLKLSESSDLKLGGYLDYGFIDIKKDGKNGLFTAPKVYHPGADNKIGTGITYNGMLNSDVSGKIKPIAFGVKIGVCFKL